MAEPLIAQTLGKERIARDQLTIHADRGSSMTSKPVAFLLADVGGATASNVFATQTTKHPREQWFRRSGRRDSNSGPLVPQTSALTRLRHAPCGQR